MPIGALVSSNQMYVKFPYEFIEAFHGSSIDIKPSLFRLGDTTGANLIANYSYIGDMLFKFAFVTD